MSTKKSSKIEKTDIPLLNQIQVRGESYSREDCLVDLKSIAEEFPFRRITRDFYRQHADIPEAAWVGIFGTFPEFLRAAGLLNTRYDSKIINATAKHASMDEVRKVSEERKQYGETYDRDKQGRFRTLIGCSDIHDKECDPFFLRVLIDTIDRIEPDVISIGGDFFDFPEFGKYSVDPREYDLTGRIKAGHAILAEMRRAAPNAQIDLIEGNHEARLLKHLTECSPQMREILSGLHEMNIQKLLKLDEYEVNYWAQCDLFTFTDAQMKREINKNYKVYWDSLLVHHFPNGKQQHLPGFNGHHHQHLVHSFHTADRGAYEWHQLGAGHARTASYCNGERWNNGFIIAEVDTHSGEVNFDYITVGLGFAMVVGKRFERQESEFTREQSKEYRVHKARQEG